MHIASSKTRSESSIDRPGTDFGWKPRNSCPIRGTKCSSSFPTHSSLQSLTPTWLHFSVVTPPPIRIAAGTLIDYRLTSPRCSVSLAKSHQRVGAAMAFRRRTDARPLSALAPSARVRARRRRHGVPRHCRLRRAWRVADQLALCASRFVQDLCLPPEQASRTVSRRTRRLRQVLLTSRFEEEYGHARQSLYLREQAATWEADYCASCPRDRFPCGA